VAVTEVGAALAYAFDDDRGEVRAAAEAEWGGGGGGGRDGNGVAQFAAPVSFVLTSQPARYELAAVKHLHHVAFSFYYQTLFRVRLVSLGGEVLTGRPPFATAGEDVLPSMAAATHAPSSESTSTVIRIGGSWQVRLPCHDTRADANWRQCPLAALPLV